MVQSSVTRGFYQLGTAVELQATSIEAALAATRPVGLNTDTPTNTAGINANPYQRSTFKQACIGPRPGYAWVSNGIGSCT